MLDLIREIGSYAGLAAFLGLAILSLLYFTTARDLKRLRDWAGSAPERDAERKEATSAMAAQRAEELRRQEEARRAEQQAAALREERRRRREAGLPEVTRGERLRESATGAGHLLWEFRYVAALVVVVLAIAGGAAYAVLGGGGDSGGGGGGQSHKGKGASAPKLARSDIEVTVLNGTAVSGLAGRFGDKLEREGYQLGAVTNSTSSFTNSVVMFTRGHEPEGKRVARDLGISRVQLMTADIASVSAGAPVSVVVGEDNASTTG